MIMTTYVLVCTRDWVALNQKEICDIPQLADFLLDNSIYLCDHMYMDIPIHMEHEINVDEIILLDEGSDVPRLIPHERNSDPIRVLFA